MKDYVPKNRSLNTWAGRQAQNQYDSSNPEIDEPLFDSDREVLLGSVLTRSEASI